MSPARAGISRFKPVSWHDKLTEAFRGTHNMIGSTAVAARSMERDYHYLEGGKMNNVLRHSVVLLCCTLVAGCELLCQAGTATCGMSREEMDKLLHPKGYGEYFSKPGMTTEIWRHDWVACGGMNDGSYVAKPRLEGETNSFAASGRKARALDGCMKQKGYEFSRTRP